MTRRSAAILAGVAAVAAVVAGVALAGGGGDQAPQASPGQVQEVAPNVVLVPEGERVPLPAFTGETFDGASLDLAALPKPLVLNFWASWCTPCRKEMPVLQALSQQLRGRVDFLGVDYLDQAGAARRLAAETGVTYRLAADPRGRAGAELGITGLPTTLFIDAGGVLVGRRVGELDARRLREAIGGYLRVEP